jgi:hypothetical protein
MAPKGNSDKQGGDDSSWTTGIRARMDPASLFQVNEVLSSSHHTANQLHAYPLEQESEHENNELFVESMLQDYALVYEDAYLSGSSDINPKPFVNQTQKALRLRSVGLMFCSRMLTSPAPVCSYSRYFTMRGDGICTTAKCVFCLDYAA